MSKISFLKIIFLAFFLFSLFLSSLSFATTLNSPTIIFPTAADSPILAGQIKFEWSDVGANFYEYFINLPDGSSKQGVIGSNSVKIYDLKLGKHSWAVRSCDDSNCQTAGNWSSTPPIEFEIISAPKEQLKGLVPCGRLYDDPETTILESEPCQFQHIFWLLKNVLDFILWRLGLIALVLLTMATGLVFYFSVGGPETLVKAKSIMNSAIVGYIIIFLAWLAVNLILKLLGYTLDWWVIKF